MSKSTAERNYGQKSKCTDEGVIGETICESKSERPHDFISSHENVLL